MRKKTLLTGIVGIMLFGLMGTNVHAVEDKTERLSGKTRYETSVKIAEHVGKKEKVQEVILSSAKNFPDSLGGAVLSGQNGAPILLVGSGYKDSQDSFRFIQKNLAKSGTIYILGGTGAVSEEIVAELKKQGYKNIQRLHGKDRYQTNVEIIESANIQRGTPFILATGGNFPDALSMSSVSAINHYPILLTASSGLKSESLNLLKSKRPSTVYIAGGEGVIPKKVEEQIKSVSPETKIKRLGGATRYETSAKIASEFAGDFSKQIVVSTGKNFPDALSGSSLAFQAKAPILLINNTMLPHEEFFFEQEIENAILLGGTSVVSENVEIEIDEMISGYEGDQIEEFNVSAVSNDYGVTTVYIQATEGSDKAIQDFAEDMASMIRASNEQPIENLVIDINYGQHVFAY